jgi:hypothetical protein
LPYSQPGDVAGIHACTDKCIVHAL